MGLDLPKEHQLRYLKKRSADIEEIKNGVLCDNFDAAVIIGHKLKGSGETFGFPLITTYGSVLEKAGLCRDKEKIAESLVGLTECIRNYLNEMED